MRVKRILLLLACGVWVALLALCFEFFCVNRPPEPAQENQECIRVLAPYEIRPHQQILEEIGEEYSRGEERPKIIFEFVSQESVSKELSIRSLAGKDRVDVVICSKTLMPELIRQEMLKELLISRQLYNRIKQASLWDSTKGNGKHYGIPFTCDPYVLYYRKEALEEKGCRAPKTWEELMECGKKLQTLGTISIGAAGKRPEEATSLYQMLLYGMGGNLYSIDKETGIRAFQNLQRMAGRRLLIKEMVSYTKEDLAREFAQGKLYLMINRMSAASILRTSRISFEIGMARLPADKAGGEFLYGENIGLTAEAGEKAQDFLNYLLKPEVSERICSAMDTLPVFSDVAYHKKNKIFLEDAEKILDEARMLETYVHWSSISEAIAQGVYRAVLESGISAEEIAEKVYDQVRVAILSE